MQTDEWCRIGTFLMAVNQYSMMSDRINGTFLKSSASNISLD
jgi:hypothetical protein